MYLSDKHDRAIPLLHLPRPASTPPLIVSSDIEFRFAYDIASNFFLQRGSFSETEQDGLLVKVDGYEWQLSQEHTSDLYVIWELGSTPAGYIYQQYCDQEHMKTHPLTERGMFPCGVFEVKPSAWLHHLQDVELEQFPAPTMNVDAPVEISPLRPMAYHHLLFTFRNATLEFITDRLSYELFQGVERVRDQIQYIKWGVDAYGGPPSA